jgi:acylphosphatase
MRLMPSSHRGTAKQTLARKYRVRGRVQGVGYRYFVEKAANELGIRGHVKNLRDGSVEVYAIGEANCIRAFKEKLAEGPPAARVTGIEESEEAVRSDYGGFSIEH